MYLTILHAAKVSKMGAGTRSFKKTVLSHRHTLKLGKKQIVYLNLREDQDNLLSDANKNNERKAGYYRKFRICIHILCFPKAVKRLGPETRPLTANTAFERKICTLSSNKVLSRC